MARLYEACSCQNGYEVVAAAMSGFSSSGMTALVSCVAIHGFNGVAVCVMVLGVRHGNGRRNRGIAQHRG